MQEGKIRPIKICFGSLSEKAKVMGTLRNLKGIDKYKKVSITNNYTLTERKVIKEWTQKAKQQKKRNQRAQKLYGE